MLSGFNLQLSPRIVWIEDYIWRQKRRQRPAGLPKGNSSRPQSSNRNTQGASPSALELLKQDHREVEEWFDEYNELKEDDDRKRALVEKICLALKVHAQIEEEIFYPQAREATKDNDLIDEAAVEHATVKHLIGEIEGMEVDEELYDAKIRVPGEMVKHHIKEEEKELFPELVSAKMVLDAVGKELAKRKEELMAEMQA
jgi:hemerythrin superfamily protein